MTATFEQPKGFLEDAAPVMRTSCGTAFGENAVQLAHELAQLKPKDPEDPANIPLRRLKGAL